MVETLAVLEICGAFPLGRIGNVDMKSSILAFAILLPGIANRQHPRYLAHPWKT